LGRDVVVVAINEFLHAIVTTQFFDFLITDFILLTGEGGEQSKQMLPILLGVFFLLVLLVVDGLGIDLCILVVHRIILFYGDGIRIIQAIMNYIKVRW
jgi:hypothetical protein